MNLTKLFEMQRVLDERIVKEKGLEGKDLLPQKILALQVELGECANEWRGFKFWSNRQEPKMFPLEQCDYCGDEVSYTRPSPFMADAGADMCKDCWDMTQKEYGASDGEYIPDFKDYPHFSEKKPQKLLEEYIDCLHFFLSIGLDYGVDIKIDLKLGQSKDVMILFALVNRYVAEMWWEFNDKTGQAAVKWLFAMQHFLRLGEMLGFTQEQIEAAYIAKNEVNHDRQSTGY